MVANETERDNIITRLLLVLLFGGILVDLLILITAPDTTISASGLPKGVNLKASGLWPATPATQPSRPTPTRPVADIAGAIAPVSIPAPAAKPTPTPAPVGIIPTRMWIPNIGVDARVEKVGRTKTGAMDTPKDIWDVGWFEPGTRPGTTGTAVIAGHLDGPNTAAVFWDLKKMKVGQRVHLADDEGHVLDFQVFEIAVYPYDKAPVDRIFGTSGATGIYLNLITCNGTFDTRSQNYDNRLVVYTRLVEPYR